MASRSFTYLDIPESKRRETATKVISRLRERLSDPLSTPEQVVQVNERVSRLEMWANGKLPANPEG